MAPLVALGLSILPALARPLLSDRAGRVAADVARTVQDSTGTRDAVAARASLDTDPALEAALRAQLAGIAQDGARAPAAAARDRAWSDAPIPAPPLPPGPVARRLALGGSATTSIAWGAPVVSCLVTIGFFCIVGTLLVLNTRLDDSTAALVNITVGALGAAFTAVVNFWIGSSQGSRDKDETVRRLASQGMAQASGFAGQPAPLPAALGLAAFAAPAPVRGARFDHCLRLVLEKEGGYVNHPRDPGGPTNLGITQATLADFRGEAVTAEDVQALTVAEAGEIYRAHYWNRLRCDALPPGIDLMVFDFGVNAGPAASARLLQRAVGVRDDGAIGPITLGAARACDPVACIERLAETRDAFYRRIPTFPTFGRGWLSRTEFMRRAALAMID